MKEKIITKKILKWYDLNKRPLPWRKKVSVEKKQLILKKSVYKQWIKLTI